MNFQSILVTGGAGFLGSSLALLFRSAFPELPITCLDNLKRRGSELNLPRLQAAGVAFQHGDIRCPEDLESLPPFDLLIDCSAEPSVQAGTAGSPRYVLETNLAGTINCLEAARHRGAAFLFISTSRVYPIIALNSLPYCETETRYCWNPEAATPGVSAHGIAEDFSLQGARSFYGTSKLACEQLISEYVYSYGLRALINRCGILAGPWQMGKVDQGVVTLWVARHHFQQPLCYLGFGGAGKQVRDVLHVHDFFDLLQLQLADPNCWDGRIYNIGGGNDGAVSLRELTALCVEATGRSVPIESRPDTADTDLRIYVTDARRAQQDFGWRPARTPADIVRDISAWLDQHEAELRPFFAPASHPGATQRE